MGGRLIDADKLIELIDDDIASLNENMTREGYDVCLCTLLMAKQYIKAVPTAETEPIEIRAAKEQKAYNEGYYDGYRDGAYGKAYKIMRGGEE